MELLNSRLKNRMSRWPLASLLAAVCAALGASHAQAQLYKWTDENGKTHYSDSMPPNAVDRARKEMRSDGVVKNSIERAMTPEEKRLAAVKALEDEKIRTAQSERERKDKALLATYTDLKDFDRVRDRTLAALDDEIKGLSAATVTAAQSAPAPAVPKGAASPSSGKPPAAGPSGASANKPTTPATASAAHAAAVAEQQQRMAQAAATKRRERDDLAAMYDAERARLAALLVNDRSRITTVNVTAPRK